MPGMIPRGARRPGACPRCGGTHLVRKGHDRGGSQGRSRGSCGRAPSRKAMGPLGCPEPEGGVWAGYAGHACAGGTPGECAGACGVCPGTSRLVRTGPSEAVGRALAPPGRGQPSPAKSTARTSASRRPAGGPGRRRRCPGSRGARRRRARARHIGPRGVRGRRGVSSAWRCATHARPEGFLARLGGVPPGRPGHYPGWFLWDEQTRGSDADRADTLSGQAATGSYDNTRFALAREPQPLWSYWEDKLAVSTVV